MPFDDLVGNKRIKLILTSYLKNDIIPFGMIFFGPGSANILSFATGFAKALNCLKRDNDFCNECRNCIEVEKGIFLDLNILSPGGQYYKKEQITFLIGDSHTKPLKGNKKIYILTDVHRMSESSSNAFLKVLEEPAPSNVFILLTNNLNALLPTIKSRCQIISFSPLLKSEIKNYLTELGYDEKKAQLISYLSQSSIENLISVNYDEYMQKRASVLSILTKLVRGKGVEDILLDFYNKSRSREKFIKYFKELVNLISLMLRDIMILKIDNNSENLINVDYKEDLMDLSGYVTVERVLFLLRQMEFLLRDIQRNLNTRVLILEFIKSYSVKEVQYV